VTQVTSRELETLLQLACFHYITAAQVEGFLFDGSTLLPASRTRVARRILAARGVEHWMAHRCRHYWATSNHRNGMTIFDIAAEGGWKDSEMVRRYTHDRPFEELQAMPTALTAMLRRRAS
jgi:integrase